MQNDWESKFYKEVAEIKGIKEGIKKIRSSHKKLADSLLDTQRIVVKFMILHDAAYYNNIVRQQKPEMARSFFTQLTSDASGTRIRVKTSQNPLSIYAEFKNTISKRLKDEGIKLIDIN